MRSLLLITVGFVLAFVCAISFYLFFFITHPIGALTNSDYPLVQVSKYEGKPLFELRKGEAKLLEYGEYTIQIPEIKASFVLFKNNRGTCDIKSADGTLLVKVNENANIFTASPESSTK